MDLGWIYYYKMHTGLGYNGWFYGVIALDTAASRTLGMSLLFRAAIVSQYEFKSVVLHVIDRRNEYKLRLELFALLHHEFHAGMVYFLPYVKEDVREGGSRDLWFNIGRLFEGGWTQSYSVFAGF
jgi:hypothetical protein